MDWPAWNGPEVVSVFTSETSTEAAAVPPLPVLSVLFAVFESDSAGVAVAVLSNAPAAVIVAVTLIVTFAPLASEAIMHGLSLIHISEPTRLGMISYAVFC